MDSEENLKSNQVKVLLSKIKAIEKERKSAKVELRKKFKDFLKYISSLFQKQKNTLKDIKFELNELKGIIQQYQKLKSVNSDIIKLSNYNKQIEIIDDEVYKYAVKKNYTINLKKCYLIDNQTLYTIYNKPFYVDKKDISELEVRLNSKQQKFCSEDGFIFIHSGIVVNTSYMIKFDPFGMIAKHKIVVQTEKAFITIIDKFLISITMKPGELNGSFYLIKYETESLRFDSRTEIDFLSAKKYESFDSIVNFKNQFYLCNDRVILIANYTSNLNFARVIELIDKIYFIVPQEGKVTAFSNIEVETDEIIYIDRRNEEIFQSVSDYNWSDNYFVFKTENSITRINIKKEPIKIQSLNL